MFCHRLLNLHGFAVQLLCASSGESLAQEDGSGASGGRSVSVLLPRLLVRHVDSWRTAQWKRTSHGRNL